ncbi:MAG: type 1 glutamine amidotransferase domain-containing protein, partial [bacterium]
KYGYPVKADRSVYEVKAEDLDGIVIPGGWAPDKLRMSEEILELVREVMRRGKVIACICHGGWVLASADVVRGKRVTSYKAIKDDLIHAGAQWLDEEVVVDGNLITSRKPEDLFAFMRETIRALER